MLDDLHRRKIAQARHPGIHPRFGQHGGADGEFMRGIGDLAQQFARSGILIFDDCARRIDRVAQMPFAVIDILRIMRRAGIVLVGTEQPLGDQAVRGVESPLDSIVVRVGDENCVPARIVLVGGRLAIAIGHTGEIAITIVGEADRLRHSASRRGRQLDPGQPSLRVMGKLRDLTVGPGHQRMAGFVADAGRPGDTRSDLLGQGLDAEAGIVSDRDQRTVGLADRGDPVAGAVIGVAGDVGRAVCNRMVAWRQVGDDADQPVGRVIGIACPGKCAGGGCGQIGVAGDDLGDVVAVPDILGPAAIRRRHLVELVARIGESQRIAVAVGLRRDPPIVGAMRGIGLGDLAVAVGPYPLARRMGQPVMCPGAFGRDIGVRRIVP